MSVLYEHILILLHRFLYAILMPSAYYIDYVKCDQDHTFNVTDVTTL